MIVEPVYGMIAAVVTAFPPQAMSFELQTTFLQKVKRYDRGS
jgi:hypothetical protein